MKVEGGKLSADGTESWFADGRPTVDGGRWLNVTGIHPTEFKLLVKPKAAEEVSKGGIIIPTSTAEAEKFAQTEGVVIAVSPLAFTYAKDEEWKAACAKPPQPGQTVLYAKYAGNWVKGKDGGEYLLINDKDVGAIIED